MLFGHPDLAIGIAAFIDYDRDGCCEAGGLDRELDFLGWLEAGWSGIRHSHSSTRVMNP